MAGFESPRRPALARAGFPYAVFRERAPTLGPATAQAGCCGAEGPIASSPPSWAGRQPAPCLRRSASSARPVRQLTAPAQGRLTAQAAGTTLVIGGTARVVTPIRARPALAVTNR